MVKTSFQIKVSVATRTRAMRASQWYQSFEELMKESTYWSWVTELWNWTSMDQYRSRFLKVIVWLALGNIKEGELREKLDWKMLEHWFRSCIKMSYGASLAGWFWLSKLEEMNGGWPYIYRESNGMSKRVKWWSLEGNHEGFAAWAKCDLFSIKTQPNCAFHDAKHLRKVAKHD